MKKSFVSLLLLTLALVPAVCAQSVLDTVLDNTDPVLSAAFREAQANMPVFSVPAPVSISPDGRYTDTPAGEYMPIHKRAVFEYEYTSSEFIGSKTIRIEYMSYSDQSRTAAVNMVIFNKTNPKVVNYVITADSYGIRSSDSPLYGPRLEFPVPLKYNAIWNEGPDRNRVAALNSKVTVPAGTYNGCMKITTRLSGGDAGLAVRYYAPGIGLISENINSEDRQETIELIAYQIK